MISRNELSITLSTLWTDFLSAHFHSKQSSNPVDRPSTYLPFLSAHFHRKQSSNPVDHPSTCFPFLSAHFNRRRSSNPVDRPSTCLPLLSPNTIALRCRGRWKCSCSIWNSYGLTDPFCTSPLVWCRLPMFWPVKSMWCFGGFPLLARDWLMSPQFRKVNLPPLWPNTDKFSYYLHTLSKVFEHLTSVRFGRFIECTCALSSSQFPYMKWLGTCDAVVCISHTLLSVLEKMAGGYNYSERLAGSAIRGFFSNSALWTF